MKNKCLFTVCTHQLSGTLIDLPQYGLFKKNFSSLKVHFIGKPNTTTDRVRHIAKMSVTKYMPR